MEEVLQPSILVDLYKAHLSTLVGSGRSRSSLFLSEEELQYIVSSLNFQVQSTTEPMLLTNRILFTSYYICLYMGDYKRAHSLLHGIETSLLPEFTRTYPQTDTDTLSRLVLFEVHRAIALVFFTEYKYDLCLEHIHTAMNVYEKMHKLMQPVDNNDNNAQPGIIANYPLAAPLDLPILSLVDLYVLLVCAYTAMQRYSDALVVCKQAIEMAHTNLVRLRKSPPALSPVSSALTLPLLLLTPFTYFLLAFILEHSPSPQLALAHDWYQRAWQVSTSYHAARALVGVVDEGLGRVREKLMLLGQVDEHRDNRVDERVVHIQQTQQESKVVDDEDGNWFVPKSSNNSAPLAASNVFLPILLPTTPAAKSPTRLNNKSKSSGKGTAASPKHTSNTPSKENSSSSKAGDSLQKKPRTPTSSSPKKSSTAPVSSSFKAIQKTASSPMLVVVPSGSSNAAVSSKKDAKINDSGVGRRSSFPELAPSTSSTATVHVSTSKLPVMKALQDSHAQAMHPSTPKTPIPIPPTPLAKPQPHPLLQALTSMIGGLQDQYNRVLREYDVSQNNSHPQDTQKKTLSMDVQAKLQALQGLLDECGRQAGGEDDQWVSIRREVERVTQQYRQMLAQHSMVKTTMLASLRNTPARPQTHAETRTPMVSTTPSQPLESNSRVVVPQPPAAIPQPLSAKDSAANTVVSPSSKNTRVSQSNQPVSTKSAYVDTHVMSLPTPSAPLAQQTTDIVPPTEPSKPDTDIVPPTEPSKPDTDIVPPTEPSKPDLADAENPFRKVTSSGNIPIPTESITVSRDIVTENVEPDRFLSLLVVEKDPVPEVSPPNVAVSAQSESLSDTGAVPAPDNENDGLVMITPRDAGAVDDEDDASTSAGSLSSGMSSVSADSALDTKTNSQQLPLDCPSELLTPRDEAGVMLERNQKDLVEHDEGKETEESDIDSLESGSAASGRTATTILWNESRVQEGVEDLAIHIFKYFAQKKLNKH